MSCWSCCAAAVSHSVFGLAVALCLCSVWPSAMWEQCGGTEGLQKDSVLMSPLFRHQGSCLLWYGGFGMLLKGSEILCTLNNICKRYCIWSIGYCQIKFYFIYFEVQTNLKCRMIRMHFVRIDFCILSKQKIQQLDMEPESCTTTVMWSEQFTEIS